MTQKIIKATFVPNSFQTPNAYVDQIMPLLTDAEYKVLSYATRRILGFQKRQDRISISQFTEGTRSKDGDVLDSGTGLSIETVKRCLASLAEFGLMERVEENDPKTNDGILWGLQWDDEQVNWQALLERDEKKAKANAERIAKARSVRQNATPPSGTERTPFYPTDPPPFCGTETQKTGETQGNPDLIIKEALELFKGYFGKFLSEKELSRWTILYEAAGKERSEELLVWAFKKEIHLTNRGGLLDSLETAAKNWREKSQPKGANHAKRNTTPRASSKPTDAEDAASRKLAEQIRADRAARQQAGV